jgi:hypothetical protein
LRLGGIVLEGGFDIAGRDNVNPPQVTARILVRDNIIGVTGLDGADGRAFEFLAGGGDYTITHNTIINTALPPAYWVSDVAMVQTPTKINNFVFTNNLSTLTSYGFFGAVVSEGTVALNKYFTNWTFSKNVLVGRAAGNYPAGSFFPANVTAVHFVNFAGGNYTLAAAAPTGMPARTARTAAPMAHREGRNPGSEATGSRRRNA